MTKTHIVYRRSSYSAPAGYFFAGSIEKETDKRVTLATGSGTHVRPADVVARFATAEEAERLANAVAGVQGEYRRRERAAADAANRDIARLIAEAVRA